jgi:hypothetical protein
MGAWGEKAFQNDSAHDWVTELEMGGLATLRETLSAVATAGVEDYLDVDDGCRAIAAAEVVVAGLGLRDGATPAVRTWLATHRGDLDEEDRDLARRAVERVLCGQSELRELWEENGAESPWHADVRTLLATLGGQTTVRKAASTSREPAGASLEQEKQVLFTFLKARGLEPSPQERARIEASRDKEEVHRWLARATSVTSVANLLDD